MNYNDRYTRLGDRADALAYMKSLKEANPNLTVLDIGASANPWSKEFCTHVIDEVKGDLNVKYFIGNANDITIWEEVLKYVEEHGKFDFCVSTHFLEDITAAKMVMTMINRIAKEGYVAVPSKFAELSVQNEYQYLGWCHHSWIYDFKDRKFIGYKKSILVEHFPQFRAWGENHRSPDIAELQFFWKDSLVHEMAMNEHLGPTSAYVIDYYIQHLLT